MFAGADRVNATGHLLLVPASVDGVKGLALSLDSTAAASYSACLSCASCGASVLLPPNYGSRLSAHEMEHINRTFGNGAQVPMTVRVADTVCVGSVCFAKALFGCASANAPVGVLGIGMDSSFPWKQVSMCFDRRSHNAAVSFRSFDESTASWLQLGDSGVRYRGSLDYLSAHFDNVSISLSTVNRYSFVPSAVFARMRHELLNIVPLGHGLHWDYADASALGCFRVEPGYESLLEGAVPDLGWLLHVRGKALLFEAPDGSRCVGVFPYSGNDVVLGRNALGGALVRLDHVNKRMDVTTCGTDLVGGHPFMGPWTSFFVGVGLGIIVVAVLRTLWVRCKAERSKAARKRARVERRMKRRVSFEDLNKGRDEEAKSLVAEARRQDAAAAAEANSGAASSSITAAAAVHHKPEEEEEVHVADV